MVDVSVPVNGDLVLFESLILQESRPEFVTIILVFHNVHLNASWQDLVGGSLGVNLFEKSDIHLVELSLGGSLKDQGGFRQVDCFILYVCVRRRKQIKLGMLMWCTMYTGGASDAWDAWDANSTMCAATMHLPGPTQTHPAKQSSNTTNRSVAPI